MTNKEALIVCRSLRIMIKNDPYIEIDNGKRFEKKNLDFIDTVIAALKRPTCEVEPDGTLIIDLPIEVEKVGRILLTKSDTNVGSLYYPERDEDDLK